MTDKAESDQARECGHVDWKRMYESAIKCAENTSKTADHLRDLLDRLAPDWRSLDAPGRRFKPTGDQAIPPATAECPEVLADRDGNCTACGKRVSPPVGGDS